MNCTYKSLIENNTDYEQVWLQEVFTCGKSVQLYDFIFIFIFKLQQSVFKMGGIIFLCFFLYVNGTHLIYRNFFCNDIILLIDHSKNFEFVAAFIFIFWLSYFIEFFQITQQSVSEYRPPHHTFALNISSLVVNLTFGVGFVFLITKGKIRIPYYSSYLHFIAMTFYLCFFLICSFVGSVNYYLLLLPLIFYGFYLYLLFKFSTFDKFLEEKFRSTVYKNKYDLAYYYEPLTKEQLEALNQKKQKVKIDLDNLSDSEDDEEDEIIKKNRQNDFKKILIQQLEEEFQEKPSLLEKIENTFVINKNQNFIVYQMEKWVLIISSFFLPSSQNYLSETHLKIIIQYFGFCIAVNNIPNMTLYDTLFCSFFFTIIFYCVLYFLSANNKKMFKSMISIFVISSLINFISRIFLDIFQFFAFYFNFEKIDQAILKGFFRIIPLIVLIQVLASQDRLVLGYAILMVSTVGLAFIATIFRFNNLISYGLTGLNIKEIYKKKDDYIKVTNQLSLMVLFLAFVILLHLIYTYMRNQVGTKSFGIILITVGFAYMISNVLLII